MPAKPVGIFALQAAALGLLLVFLPGMKSAYPQVFAAHAEPLFSVAAWLGSESQVRFIALDPAQSEDGADLRMVGFGADGKRRHWRTSVRMWSRGWWPSAALIGLVLATPLPGWRRLRALVLGLALLDLLVLLRVAVLAGALYAATAPGGQGMESRGLQVAIESFNSWVPPLVSVLLVWALVASPARHIDLARALDKPPPRPA